jgi:lysozyme
MKTSPEGIALIKRFEGCRLEAYLCPANVWTIGYGHTGADVVKGLKVSQETADILLRRDLLKFEAAVERAAGPAYQNQFDAMVSLCYNIGPTAFAKSSVARLHKNGQYANAAQAFLLWNKGGGKVLPGLVKRRNAERNLYLGEADV